MAMPGCWLPQWNVHSWKIHLSSDIWIQTYSHKVHHDPSNDQSALMMCWKALEGYNGMNNELQEWGFLRLCWLHCIAVPSPRQQTLAEASVDQLATLCLAERPSWNVVA
jgi:hypothetical protein